MNNYLNLKNQYLLAIIKAANENSEFFQQNGNTFPNITSQTKWQFARQDGHIHLTDGLQVYSFNLPEGEKEDAFPAKKIEQSNFQFKDKGQSAQIHRADPGQIYLTLHNGKNNKTYTIKHDYEDNWKFIPKQKKIDKIAFELGVRDKLASAHPILDKIFQGVNSAGKLGVKAVMNLGKDPLASAALGLGLGTIYDLGKRTLYNTPEENAAEMRNQRIARYVLPTIGMGLVGGAAGMFPNQHMFNNNLNRK
jgi:hypothetical protein